MPRPIVVPKTDALLRPVIVRKTEVRRRRVQSGQASTQEKKYYVVRSSMAAAKFYEIINTVRKDEIKVCVKDKSEQIFMTVDHIDRYKDELMLIPIGPQAFKDNFSSCAALVKLGFRFVVSSRDRSNRVYIRRHTGYNLAIDGVIDYWIRNLFSNIEKKILESYDEYNREIISKIKELSENFDTKELKDSLVNSMKDLIKNNLLGDLKLAFERMLIGHHPFREGELPKSLVRSIRDTK